MSNSKVRILDVGCGSSKIEGAVGIDLFELPGVDVVHNLNSIPWPFESLQFDRIVFCHSISHLHDMPSVIAECNRLLKVGGLIEIVAPHYASDNFNTDPTHKCHMGIRSMNFFVGNVNFGYRYVSQECRFELLRSCISFREASTSWRHSKKFNPFKILGFEWLVNKFSRFYEHFLCWIFPPSEVYFLLKKCD